jgi:hypothetical protein
MIRMCVPIVLISAYMGKQGNSSIDCSLSCQVKDLYDVQFNARNVRRKNVISIKRAQSSGC